MSAPKKTYHCTGCRNVSAWSRDVVEEACCTCCRDADGNRPGRG